MKGDFTRSTFRPRKHYRNINHQQGRVGLDADWNEQAEITAYRAETEARDIIGLCGAPKQNAGFGIGAPATGSDFSIGRGRFYVEGILCENEEDVVFSRQPDLPQKTYLPVAGRYFVYLDVWQRHLTALDDPEIREVALGGPDTATRTKTVWQVRTLRVGGQGAAVACASDPQEWKDNIAASTIQLTARVAKEEPSDKPCIVPPGAGYRRLENQLYRVEIHRAGTINDADPAKVTTFKWSRDNGSVAARIGAITAGGEITLTSARRDHALGFAEGQWIELLDDRNDWNRTPGILVPITKVDDLVLTVDTAQAIAPPGTSFAQFATPLEQEFHPKVRRWDSAGVTAAMIPGTNDGFLALEDGVEVKFTSGTCRSGDYWLIPARTDHGDIEWPQDSASPSNPLPQLPAGILHHFCRLAVIDVDANGDTTKFEDCRPIFPELTELDDCCGCCSKTVGTSGAADYRSIQEAINSLPATGGQICVLEGMYPESVLIARKRNITIIGCGGRSMLAPGSRDEVELGPIIQIEDSANIRLESLSFFPGLRSAVVVLESRNVTVCECEFIMFNPRSSEPAIYFQAEEGLIERNSISAAAKRIFRGEESVLDERVAPGESASAHGASGIQLAGGCRRVRVLDNLISEVRGQGITLGNLEEVPVEGRPEVFSVEESRLKRKIVFGHWRYRDDPCDDCKGVTTKVPPQVPPRPNQPPTKLVSPESLWDIRIERNRIRSTGRDGIGVIGFFDLSEADEFVTVRRLTILGNEIAGCLRFAPEPIERAMVDSMGYGGVALADVSELVIHDNVIERNGANQNQPVCGIFVLHGEGIDIERNRILGNGFELARSVFARDKSAPSEGRRGGIQVVYALAPVVVSISYGLLTAAGDIRWSARKGEPTGFPALKIHDNIVSSPIGPALSAVALGPVSVEGNQLTSGRLIARERSSVFAPATVFIFNLGISNEAYFQQAAFAAVGAQQTSPLGGLDDLRPGDRLANGNILFADNQCSLDLLEPGKGVVYTSLLLASLDDIGFLNNQCDCNLAAREDLVAVHAFLFGFSVRAIGNRFKEGLFSAVYSAITTGLLNTTAHNQATHCLRVNGWPGLTQDGPNTVLRSAHCRPEFRTTWTNLEEEKNQ